MAEMTIREMASMGGKARAAKLTKAQRKAIGKNAIAARWAQHKKVMKRIDEGLAKTLDVLGKLEKKNAARVRGAKVKKEKA
jgi:hypothetical protein